MSARQLQRLARHAVLLAAQNCAQLSSRELLGAQLGSSSRVGGAALRAGLRQQLHTASGGGGVARLGLQQQQQQLVQTPAAAAVWRRLVPALRQQQADALAQRVAALEARVVALANSCLLSPAGQTVLGAFLPLTLIAALFPGRVAAYAYALPPEELAERAAYFTPAAARVRAEQAQRRQQPLWALLANAQGAVSVGLARLAEELAVALRGLYLAALFAPLVAAAPLAFYAGVGRDRWMLLLRWTLERAGPAFIKWGQWGSTRPDLFPRDVCAALETLQSGAPSHAPELSVAAVEDAFGRPLGELFSAWEARPVASGSIAQIHRARLSVAAAASCGVAPGTLVAVKVRHPGVGALMSRDFVLMERAAKAAGALPGLAELRLDESVRQFGGPLQEQLDLSVEAAHLSRFGRNFRSWRNVTFPTPLFPLVRPGVLVESFEPGAAINGYVAAAARAAVAAFVDDNGGSSSSSGPAASLSALPPAGTGPEALAVVADAGVTRRLADVARPPSEAEAGAAATAAAAAGRGATETALLTRLRGAIAEAGMHAYLKMLLRDNFIHADMHPGNILVREVDRSGGVAERLVLLLKQLSWGVPLPGGWREALRNVVAPPTPQLVLLDTGMTAELSAADRTSLVAFFRALTRQDGGSLARAILSMSERRTCRDPAAFEGALRDMFDALEPDVIRSRTSEVFRDMIDTLRQHQVTLKATVSTVVVTTLVLEGWSRELNPDLRIMDALRDMLAVDWKERLGRAVDRVMTEAGLPLAVA